MKGSTKRRVVFPHHHQLRSHQRQELPSSLVKSSSIMTSQAEIVSATAADTGMNSNVDVAAEQDFDDSTLSSSPFLLATPLLRNPISTPSSNLQDATVAECYPFLNGLNGSSQYGFTPFDYRPDGLLTLQEDQHVDFLYENLAEFSGRFVGLDTSRPWMVYWGMLSLHFLRQDVTVFRERVVKTFFPLQNAAGGYGGGEGHLSHLAGTYATLLSLALVGGEEAWGLTDREAMWRWLGRLKQADGGFRICEGGEEDVRGAYCAMVAISLLDLPWELPDGAPARSLGMTTFGDGLMEYLSRCQTYEGGISGAPGNEAHGAYAFCAIACLCLLDKPEAIPKYINLDALLDWLSSRQYAPEGGFAGRTNKVVDGCYSHWLGGCWPLLLGAINGSKQDATEADSGNLYNAEGLARYILNCCQNPDGGLRDKPSKRPDSYHTCYTLAGISTTEHYHYYTQSAEETPYASAFAWRVARNQERRERSPGGIENLPAFDAGCGLNAVHPVFVIPHEAVMNMRRWSTQQEKIV